MTSGDTTIGSADDDGDVPIVAETPAVARRRDTTDVVGAAVSALLRTAPLVGRAEMSVTQAAALMTERGQDYLLIPLTGGAHAVLTDADIRSRVVARGLSVDTAVGEVATEAAFAVDRAAPAVDVLTEMLERDLAIVPVLAADGRVLGVVGAGDFVAAPAGSAMALRDRLSRAATGAALGELGRGVPRLVADLVRQGRGTHEITRVLSLLHDALVRRALEIVLEAHPALDPAAITWLLLGSNARREPVLSSDVDSAVSLDDSLGDDEQAAWRAAFAEHDDLLRSAGLRIDTNGALASRPLFARTHTRWRTSAAGWIADPLADKGMIFASLMLDARALWGQVGSVAAGQMLADLRSNPHTLSLLLAETLATRARLRSMRDVLTRRDDFDLKHHALTPVVNIARWAALNVGSAEIDTRGRLSAASGSEMLSDDDATTLIEVFDVLQRVRLTYQVARFNRGEEVGDVLSMKRLSPLDRSLVGQAVREVAGIQRKMANMSHYVPIATGSECAGTDRGEA